MYLKVISRKTFLRNKFFVGIWKVNDKNSRIRIHYSEAWIRGSGSEFTLKNVMDPERCPLPIWIRIQSRSESKNTDFYESLSRLIVFILTQGPAPGQGGGAGSPTGPDSTWQGEEISLQRIESRMKVRTWIISSVWVEYYNLGKIV